MDFETIKRIISLWTDRGFGSNIGLMNIDAMTDDTIETQYLTS